MSEKMSRRELTKRALAGAAALTVPALGAAQTKDEVTDADMAPYERDLAKPLPLETRNLLRTAIKNSRDQSKARMAVKLPDISEPCFTYLPTEVKR